ncbi:MAG: DUF429 domain-containing protein [Nitrospirota bacterium]
MQPRAPTAWVAGVDGCRGGWAVALVPAETAVARRPLIRLCGDFREVLLLRPSPAVIAVDIPIGLLDGPRAGGRLCDRLARAMLTGRTSSVFSPPCRRVLRARKYEDAHGFGLSRQAFGILPKIREVDDLMTSALQQLVREAHPELAFSALAGRPMRWNKKTPAGRQERLRALERGGALYRELAGWLAEALDTFPRRHLSADDLMDALALSWTARRIAAGKARRIPDRPPRDRRSLRMEIWY